MGLFQRHKNNEGKEGIPVWFMRQAGRYHAHYQNIKKNSDFMTMCKTPELACEVTMGPIEDFDFDAAILFSDLLFPLEQLGMGLNYLQGPPKLEYHLSDRSNFNKLKITTPSNEFYDFQKKAVELLKVALPKDKTMLGFAGAPFTLYTYAVEGSHAGGLVSAKKGLYDGTFDKFCELLIPLIVEELTLQAQGGADGVCLFDTAAGELSLKDYAQFIVPKIRQVTKEIKAKSPDVKIIYYSKHTQLNYLEALADENIDVLGIDWRNDLAAALKMFSKDYYIQGNIDPVWLHLPWNDLEKNLNEFWDMMNNSGADLSKWIMGLGHGVLQHTPEENVRNTIKLIHEKFYI